MEPNQTREAPSARLRELLSMQLSHIHEAMSLNEAVVQLAKSHRLIELSARPPGKCDTFVERRPDIKVDTDVGQSLYGLRENSEMAKPLLANMGQVSGDLSPPQSPFGSNPSPWSNGSRRRIRNEDNIETRTRRRKNLFPQLEDIKSIVGDSLSKPRYCVEDLYKKTGFWQAVATNTYFTNFTLIVIVLNTIWIAVDTDYNTASVLCDAPLAFQIADNFFCSVFSLEIVSRFMAFRRKKDSLGDASFVFDAILVALMVWETWIMVAMYMLWGTKPSGSGSRSSSVLRICRIFRLMRVARTARLLNSVPELIILTKGIVVGVRSVATILVLLLLVIYVYGIIFTQLLAGSAIGVGKFDSVLQSMNFLLLQVLCGFDADFIDGLLKTGVVYYLLFLGFLLLTSLTIMNMLIGILCDVVSTVASIEKDEAFARELETQVIDMARILDTEGSNAIEKHAFDRIKQEPELVHTLHELGVDVVAISDYASFVFAECGSLSYTDFLHMVSQFRGAKGATVKEFMDLRKYFATELALTKSSLQSHLQELDHEVHEVRMSRAMSHESRDREHSPTKHRH